MPHMKFFCSSLLQTKMRFLLLLLAAHHTLADPHHPRTRRSADDQPAKVPKEQIGEEDEAFWRSKGDAELAKALSMTPNTGVAKNIIIFIGKEEDN